MPVLKYLFEYGGLRGLGDYPHRFDYFFEQSGDVNEIFTLDGELKGRLDTNIDVNSYDYILLTHSNYSRLSKAYFINPQEWENISQPSSFVGTRMFRRIKTPEGAGGK